MSEFTPEEFETRRYRQDLRDRVDMVEGDLRGVRDDMRQLKDELREVRTSLRELIDSESHGIVTRNRDVKSAFVAVIVTLATVLGDKFL